MIIQDTNGELQETGLLADQGAAGGLSRPFGVQTKGDG
jgi:hypothetical protein